MIIGMYYTGTDCHFSSVNRTMASKVDSGIPRPDVQKSSTVCTTIASPEQFHYAGPAPMVQLVRPWPYWFLGHTADQFLENAYTCICIPSLSIVRAWTMGCYRTLLSAVALCKCPHPQLTFVHVHSSVTLAHAQWPYQRKILTLL